MFRKTPPAAAVRVFRLCKPLDEIPFAQRLQSSIGHEERISSGLISNPILLVDNENVIYRVVFLSHSSKNALVKFFVHSCSYALVV